MAQVIMALAGVLMNRFEISALMLVDRNAAAKGLLALWELQTAKEKGIKLSVLRNWKGFNFPDSPTLSAYAMALKHGQTLSEQEWTDLQRRMVKYDKQLARLEIFWK